MSSVSYLDDTYKHSTLSFQRVAHNCTNICLRKQCVKYYSRFCLKHKGVIPVPRHWDLENLTLNKWLHNKPVPATCMTPFTGS
ncbi:MAG: hypothetical protein LBV62_01265 [Rickettsiales bacterium]|nr:hypothetical protein [Rickettsiales bacterium]